MGKLVSTWGVISDLHVGSDVAVFPKPFVYQKQPIKLTPLQRRLHEYWQDAVKWLLDLNPKTILSLSDLVDGTNRKDPGRGRCLTALDGQVDAVAQLLDPIVRGRKFIAVSGSHYHGSQDMLVDKVICEKLGFDTDADTGTNEAYEGAVADIVVTGTRSLRRQPKGSPAGIRVMASHETGASSAYLTTGLDKESLHANAAASIPDAVFPNFDVIIHGHTHELVRIDVNRRWMIVAPCFKAFEPWRGIMKNIGKFAQPTIGVMALQFFDDGEVLPLVKRFPPIWSVNRRLV